MKNYIEILKSKSTEEKQRIWFGVFISLILFAVLFFIFVEKFLTYEQAKALGGNTISVIMFALYLFLLSLSAKKMAGKSSLKETAKISTGLEYEKYVAKQLRHKGYLNIKVTKGTVTATKQVQKAAGIEQDGYAGAMTIRACYALLEKKL